MKKAADISKGLLEQQLISQGLIIVGCDEVGRGCLAGPVYAAAVVIDYGCLWALEEKDRKLIRDSKTLSTRQRKAILPVLNNVMTHHSIASSNVNEIEEMGIVKATFLAMHRAYLALEITADKLLIDGNQTNPFISIDQISIIGGDSSCFAIAAASILAKEARDDYMRELSASFPEYQFQDNVGYGTKSHLTALYKYGITPFHRRNFAPIHALVNGTESMQAIK